MCLFPRIIYWKLNGQQSYQGKSKIRSYLRYLLMRFASELVNILEPYSGRLAKNSAGPHSLISLLLHLCDQNPNSVNSSSN